jgi:hypothetical protein
MIACLGFSGPIFATSAIYTIDTTSSWNSISSVGPFGDNGIETFGQTFMAPTESRLDQITFFVNDELNSGTVFNPAYLDFKLYVMGWSGTKASGSILFESLQFTTSNNHGDNGLEQFDVATGGIDLTPGGSYVWFISVSGLFDGNASTGAVGFMGEFASDVYGGGEFVMIDNQQDTSKWVSENWTKPFSGKDLAFTLSFSPVPEPSVGALLLVGGFIWLRQRNRS